MAKNAMNEKKVINRTGTMTGMAVLTGDVREMEIRAADMVPLLSSLAGNLSSLELWMGYTGPVPERFPEWPVPLTRVHRVPLPDTGVPDQALDLLADKNHLSPKQVYLFAGTGSGDCLAARLGYRVQGQTCLQVQHCKMGPDNSLSVGRLVYGSHLQAHLSMDQPPWCLSAAGTAGIDLKWTHDPGCRLTDHTDLEIPPLSWIRSTKVVSVDADHGLAGADRILVLGNGVGSGQTLERMKPVARALHARIGATRPVVMNGWVPMDHLIGVSGSMVAPSLCILAGVSGTGAFCAGVRQAEWIAAVNTDPDAPVFQAADVGIVDDLVPVLLELERLIKKQVME
jgi:electron transfer flavoprotein alpha subunit